MPPALPTGGSGSSRRVLADRFTGPSAAAATIPGTRAHTRVGRSRICTIDEGTGPRRPWHEGS
jgi:hypothetical protein